MVPVLLLALPCLAQQTAKTYRVPFHSVNGLILLDAEVNGKRATLLLDTGAGRTVVSLASAPLLQWRSNEALHGKAVQVKVDLRLGENFTTSGTMAAMDLNTVEKQMNARFDGILGQDVLREFSAVRIDYKNCVVELESGR